MSCNASDVNVVSLSLSKYPAAPSGADARRCDARATRCSEGNVGVATWPRPTVRATERLSFDPRQPICEQMASPGPAAGEHTGHETEMPVPGGKEGPSRDCPACKTYRPLVSGIFGLISSDCS